MWMGKMGLIMYTFSLVGMVTAGWLNAEIFHNSTLNGNNDIAYSTLNTLFGTFNLNPSVNSNLIFGDFITVLHLIAGVLTGAGVSQFLNVFPFVDTWIHLLVQGLFFGYPAFLLIMYIVGNRSL